MKLTQEQAACLAMLDDLRSLLDQIPCGNPTYRLMVELRIAMIEAALAIQQLVLTT